MSHQYCHAYRIDDEDHNEQWEMVAKAHGLDVIHTDSGRSEQLSLLGWLAIRTFRF